MEIEMTSKDREEYLMYDNKMKYSILHDCKVVIFHSDSNGIPKDVNNWLLKELAEKKYYFLTCFPKRVKKRLGFGNFLFESHDNITFSCGVVIEDKKYLLVTEPVYLSD